MWGGVGWFSLDHFVDWCSRVRFLYSKQTCSFKIIWSRHLVKQLWPPDGCRRTEGRLSTSLAAKGWVLSTQQGKSLKWIDPSEWWWREEWLTSRESLWLPAIGNWRTRYSIWVYKRLGATSVMFPSVRHPGLIPVYQKNSCTLLFSSLSSP